MASESFPGSKTDLESMTGKTYESMKDKDGNLLMCFTVGVTSFGVDYALMKLRENAKRIGADALVHVTLHVLPQDREPGVIRYSGSGYAVKEVSRSTP